MRVLSSYIFDLEKAEIVKVGYGSVGRFCSSDELEEPP